MKQTASVLSTYAADVSGVCSALFELGGMVVMHDASGCNSTYNTHDEPRWYDMDSMVYISGLSEMEAVMGDDEKLLTDVTAAALELRPRFIAVAGSPIPMVIGTDFQALAAMLEARTGIPAFGFPTNGMHSYLAGAGMALEAIARRFCDRAAKRSSDLSVNILGATPLDLSVNGSVEAMRALLRGDGMRLIGTWAMGCTLEELARAGEARVNLVVSYAGLPVAKALREMFATPYVVGVPFGEAFSKTVLAALRRAVESGENALAYGTRPISRAPITIIGESVAAESLAAAIAAQNGKPARVLCPLETLAGLLLPGDAIAPDEDDLIPLLGTNTIIADPLYRPVCPPNARFIPLPHEAFSGRIYRDAIPEVIGKDILL